MGEVMNRRMLLASAIAITAAACSREPEAPRSPPGPDPSAVIAPLYQPYIAHGVMVGLQDQAPWSAEMRAALVAMMERSRAAGEPILDFDPIIGAQDYEISGLSVTNDALAQDSHAVVRARFTNLGQNVEVLYDMVWRDNAWRVDNIRGDGWDLRQIAMSAP